GSRRRRTHEANLGRRARRNRLRHTDCGGADRERHRTGRRCGARAAAATWHSGGGNDLADLIPEWLTLPEDAERLDVAASRATRMIADGQLVALRRGDPVVRMVPALLLTEDGLIPHLPGTITILRDGGFEDEELLTWLFTEDESLPG